MVGTTNVLFHSINGIKHIYLHFTSIIKLILLLWNFFFFLTRVSVLFYFRTEYFATSCGCESLPLPTKMAGAIVWRRCENMYHTCNTLTCIPQIGGRISGSGFWIRMGWPPHCWTTSTWSVSAWQILTEEDKLKLDTQRKHSALWCLNVFKQGAGLPLSSLYRCNGIGGNWIGGGRVCHIWLHL